MRGDEIDLVYAGGRDAVVALIAAQAARIDELVAANAGLAARVEELGRQLGRSSRNSSLPPSRDSPDARKERPKKRSERRQGGQPGHPGQHREMVADPDRLVEHWPAACGSCGAAIGETGRVTDGEPVCHQVSEIVVRTEVTEHRRMRVRCSCGRCTLAQLPAGVPAGAFGPAVAAAAATLTAARVSRRETARLLADLCGVQVSAASVEGLLKQTSDTLEDAYVEVLAAVDESAVRGADETSWQRAGQTRWLSVATAAAAALFQIADRRDRDSARALLGDSLSGTIVSDRYAVYLYIDDSQRQRALRHAVMWRKTSYGTQTDHGDRLVERLLTMRETCRLQRRRLHDYLTAAITADLHRQPIPALLAPP